MGNLVGYSPEAEDALASVQRTARNHVQPDINAWVGVRVQVRRIETGMTREDLAMNCQTDVDQLTRIERGEVQPDPTFLIAASRILQTDLRYFFQDL